MDEDQYRTAYNTLNPNRCIFEKAITNRRCNCELKNKFVLATREGVACQSETALKDCTTVLNAIRSNARFSLKVVTVTGPMPHNKELQVQAGGMLALQGIVGVNNKENRDKDIHLSTISKHNKQEIALNIHQTVTQALKQFGSIEALPYSEIVKSIVIYKARPKRQKKK